MTLNEFACNHCDFPVIFVAGVGCPTGRTEAFDAEDHFKLLELEGEINEATGQWNWNGEGHPTDCRANTILTVTAYEDADLWAELTAAE